jgi:hypothetical protein
MRYMVALALVHDRMIVEPFDPRASPVRVTPIGPEAKLPPLAPVVQIDLTRRRPEHGRARFEHIRQRARVLFRIQCDLRESDVARRLDELAELPVGDGRGSIQKPSTVTRWTGASSG